MVDIKYSEIVKCGLSTSSCDHFVLLRQRVRAAWLFGISLDALTLRLTHDGIDRPAAKPKHKFTSARPPEQPFDSNPRYAAGKEDIVPNMIDVTVECDRCACYSGRGSPPSGRRSR